MKRNPTKAFFTIVALLMLLGLMPNSPAIADSYNYNFNIANQTGNKVNCQNNIYTLYFTSTYKRSNTANKISWQAGQTYSRRYRVALACKKATFQAYCVSLADGWPRQFNITFDDCSNMNASFKIDDSGKCILRK